LGGAEFVTGAELGGAEIFASAALGGAEFISKQIHASDCAHSSFEMKQKTIQAAQFECVYESP
jgi:hypothetical protein